MNFELTSPEIALLATAVVVVLTDLFISRKRLLSAITLGGLAVAFGLSIYLWGQDSQLLLGNMLAMDGYAVFFKLLFIATATFVVLSSVDYASKFERFQGEYHAMLLLATIGLILMAATTDLIAIYVALELAAISFYVLVGFLKDRKSSESALKYLLLGGVASAVMLYGMALVFGIAGSTNIVDIAAFVQAGSGITENPSLILGIVLLIAGLGFKIAAIPFQFWVPDVYEGAPTPITMYLSVGSKVAGFALLLRLFWAAFSLPEGLSAEWGTVIAVLSAVGMTLGNVVAIVQTNIKRMLAYSSIAHAGYILVGVAALGTSSGGDTFVQNSILFYMLAFAVTDLVAFTVIIAVSKKVGSDLIRDMAGIGRQAPWLAGAMTLALMSLTGFPPTAGFIAKFYIFAAGVNHDLLWLVAIGVINTVISAYYYLRVIKVMWTKEPLTQGDVPSSRALKIALAVPAILIVILGIVPAFATELADMATRLFAY